MSLSCGLGRRVQSDCLRGRCFSDSAKPPDMSRLYAKRTRRRRFQCLLARGRCLAHVQDTLALSLQVNYSRDFSMIADLKTLACSLAEIGYQMLPDT